jgi:hypothetical protein
VYNRFFLSAAEFLWDGQEAPEVGGGCGHPPGGAAVLRTVVLGSTSGAAAAGGVGVDKHSAAHGVPVHEVDEGGDGGARADSDGEVDDP